MSEPERVKHVQVQLDRLSRERRDLKKEAAPLIRQVDAMNGSLMKMEGRRDAIDRELTTLHGELKEMTTTPIVSEHALLRYFERVLGYDLAAIAEDIMPEETVELIKKLGNGRYPVDDYKILVRGNVVVTVITKEEKKKK